MTTTPIPDSFTTLSFDVYGTLIDWETGIRHALQPWAARTAVTDSGDELVERFGRHENLVESEHPTWRYPDVLAETLRRIGHDLDAPPTEDEASAFGASVPAWPAFPDSAASLRRLATRFRLIVLSNVDRTSFAGSNRRLGVTFDAVVTAEDVGSYKPDPRNFEALMAVLPGLDVERAHLLHVAQSLFHDHRPAAAAGLPSVWIDRRHDQTGSGATPPVDATPDWRFTSLAAFADAVVGPAS
jgi:2-haloacid dehalogenase